MMTRRAERQLPHQRPAIEFAIVIRQFRVGCGQLLDDDPKRHPALKACHGASAQKIGNSEKSPEIAPLVWTGKQVC